MKPSTYRVKPVEWISLKKPTRRFHSCQPSEMICYLPIPSLSLSSLSGTRSILPVLADEWGRLSRSDINAWSIKKSFILRWNYCSTGKRCFNCWWDLAEWLERSKSDSWVRSQHPPIKWNLSCGRWSRRREYFKNPPVYKKVLEQRKLDFCGDTVTGQGVS